MADNRSLRMALLNGRKSERIIFAASPELKHAATAMAEERCMSLSAYISALIADDVVRLQAGKHDSNCEQDADHV
ncbi:hypothetical protein [Collinsella tanakaei]|uniref:hypothetical protein n=1 Tax=Collinsella tanakaei TaxID=626935 RepID=UPI00195842AC|nr:hypothetical protein [Collinsella tanakaei]MBM6867297.1 hypothetical protein [Collinsella tanakaei]